METWTIESVGASSNVSNDGRLAGHARAGEDRTGLQGPRPFWNPNSFRCAQNSIFSERVRDRKHECVFVPKQSPGGLRCRYAHKGGRGRGQGTEKGWPLVR